MFNQKLENLRAVPPRALRTCYQALERKRANIMTEDVTAVAETACDAVTGGTAVPAGGRVGGV